MTNENPEGTRTGNSGPPKTSLVTVGVTVAVAVVERTFFIRRK
jgi:hypothetical protein